MPLKLRPSNTEARQLIPVGTYRAIVIGIYDIGTDPAGKWPRRQIIVTWELHRKGLPKPLLFSKFYGLSFHTKSTLRQHVEAMKGRTFGENEELVLEDLILSSCRLQLTHGTRVDGSPREEIKSLMPLDEDDIEPRAEASPVYFEIAAAHCTIPQEVPNWIRGRIEACPEWQGTAEAVKHRPPPVDPDDEDISF